ncbi:immunoglobulin-like domain-containing protein [Lachnoclostridium phytofermentans]|uniref:Atrophied bacterial Ig domain-containing protein n=1 Tax=Lachnoclostridium phytofermentans (strain ATCC 700394 / DSM 18823 / ISDg) TaxID=357809 RepID=A9KLA7_LACP7|nr:immunoglobulin-like domain-containing protein [Lachnoclostridium phytofermentans]ABX41236.1 hypothetical protein Cphy_0850 [Lachnoclostridium phytofermentans ISDg]
MKQKKLLKNLFILFLTILISIPHNTVYASSLTTSKFDVATDTAYKLELDYQQLNPIFSANDNTNSVTSSITLPTVCMNQSTVIWYSDNEAIISSNGKVTRPTGSDTIVTLTAILINNNQTRVKQFYVLVKGTQIIVPNLTGISDNYVVTENEKVYLSGMIYATSKLTNVTVQLFKNNNKVISETKVNPQATSFNLNSISFDPNYLNLTKGTYQIKIFVASENYFDTSTPLKVCTLTVTKDKKDLLDDERDILSIIFSNNDKSSSVISNIILPVLGKYGCTITWQSSHPSIINSQGIVTRPLYDTKVKLTATLSFFGISVKKTFNLEVLGTYVKNTITIKQSENVINNKNTISLNWNSNLRGHDLKSVRQTTIQIFTYGTNDLRFEMTADTTLTSCTTRLDPGVYTVRITYNSSSYKTLASGETTIIMK